MVVACGEEREMGGDELVGERVAHGDAVQQRERAAAPARRVRGPTPGGSPSSTWTWSRENGVKRNSTSVAGALRSDHRRVAVVGERAAVVEGDGDGTGHGGS